MLYLFYGGQNSGKSRLAEDFAVALRNQATANSDVEIPLVYLSTMMPFGKEGASIAERRESHSSEKGFVTIEQYTDIANVDVPKNSVILLECVGNLLANEMYAVVVNKEATNHKIVTPDPVKVVMDGILAIEEKCCDLIVVSADVSDGCEDMSNSIEMYIQHLQKTNEELNKKAKEAFFVVAGIAIEAKIINDAIKEA